MINTRNQKPTPGSSAEIAAEIRAHFTQVAAELEAQRQQLGVEDSLKDVPGVTPAMLVALGRNGIRTVEDLAACATDDLVGWIERKGNRIKRHRGILDCLVVWAEECDSMILHARIKLGWISETRAETPIHMPQVNPSWLLRKAPFIALTPERQDDIQQP